MTASLLLGLEWCARLTEHLSVAETETLILSPIREVANARYSERLLERLMSGFVQHRFSQNQAPDESTMEVWRLLCDMVFAKSSRYDECMPLAIFCYVGHCSYDHPWPALDAVRPIVETWVERFSESVRGYSNLLVFLSRAGRGFPPDIMLGWLQRIVEVRRQDAQFWRANDNGSRTAALLELILDDHGAELTRREDLIQGMIEITDVLISVGVRLAAQIQQRLGKTTASLPA